MEVGTTREPCGNNANDNANRTRDQGGQSSQTYRRQSGVSMMSFLSLPPAYSQLQTRSGSMVSLETRMCYATFQIIEEKTSKIYYSSHICSTSSIRRSEKQLEARIGYFPFDDC